MEIVISTEDLQRALKVIAAVAKPNASDISGQVLIDASSSGDVVFLGSSNKLVLTHVVNNCEVKSEGKICIPFAKMASFINTFTSWDDEKGVKSVHIKKLKHNVSVKLLNTLENGKETRNNLTLQVYPVQNVYVPKPFKIPTFILPTAALKLAISKVIYAVNPNATRLFIQGVNISFDEEHIYFVGTDAQKLSEYKAKNVGNLKEGSFIVPYLFVMALRKITENTSQVMFEIDDGKIRVVANNTTLHGNLIIGEQYPDYKPAFANFTHTITMDKEALLSTFVPYLNILNEEDHKRLTIELNNGTLRMYSDMSDAEYQGNIAFKGNFVIDINGTFLAQTLESINDDIIDLSFSNENGVLILDSGNFHDQRSLITPIRRRS